MVQSENCLLCKHADLSSIHRIRVRREREKKNAASLSFDLYICAMSCVPTCAHTYRLWWSEGEQPPDVHILEYLVLSWLEQFGKLFRKHGLVEGTVSLQG